MSNGRYTARSGPSRTAPPPGAWSLTATAFVAAVGLAACGPAAQPERSHVIRLIDTEPGTWETTGLARVEIEADTRYVLSAQPRHVLKLREDVTVAGDLTVDIELPAELVRNAAGSLRIDAFVSLPDPASRDQTLLERRAEFHGRHVFRAEPMILPDDPARAQRSSVRVWIAVPAEFRGLPGLLTVVARPLSQNAVTPLVSEEVAIMPGARLVFGYGVEEDGWIDGWPPAAFRVFARTDDEDFLLFEHRVDPAADPRDRRWFDAAVSLERVGAARARFVFETESLPAAEPGGEPGLHTFAVFSNPRVLRAGREANRPNIVLISLDTLRARSVSSYGYPLPTTPTIDARVAAAGARMAVAVTPAPYTPPAHMSMLTGLAPCAHGITQTDSVLPDGIVTLAEILRAQGYETAAFTENGYLVAGAGFDRGFDRYAEHRSEETAAPGFAAETFAAAEAWLNGPAGRPFFLFIHTYSVHGPYSPPRGYAHLFAEEFYARYKPRFRASARAYDQEIRYTDDVLAGFLDALDIRGLADDTILVVTSDHGEAFGEHGLTGHGFSLHDEVMLVPLLIRAPGRVSPGRVVTEQVGLIDLMPTVLDLGGVPVPSDVDGRSFAGLLRGEGGFEERPLLLSMGKKLRGIRTREYKYTASTKESLYRLDRDPTEIRNLRDAEPDLVAKAREIFRTRMATCEQDRQRRAAGAAHVTAVHATPAWQVDREEIDRKLRSLGYLD